MTIKTEVRDVAERAGWTFAETLLAVWVLSDLTTIRTAAISAAAAALVPIKDWVKAKRAAASARASL